MAGTPIPANDLWIAAFSRQHSTPVMSHDEHFDFVSGLRRQTWQFGVRTIRRARIY